MLCPKCMSEIPDDSRRCPRCRAVILDTSPLLAATDVSREIPQQEKRIRSLLIGVFLVLVLGWLGGMVARRTAARRHVDFLHAPPSQTQRIKVVQSMLTFKPGVVMSFKFFVPPGCLSASLEGRFTPGNQQGFAATQMTVFDAASYAKWRTRSPSQAIYSGKIPTSALTVSLPIEPKDYFLVVAPGAGSQPTSLQADVELLCGRVAQ